jgi:daunorubicin/doxorubicin transport system permease protein
MTSPPSAQPRATSGGTLEAAAPARARLTGAGTLSASLTFAWRALLKIKHMPEQLADVIGIPILFTLMFTYLFGGALAGSTRGYLQFLLPGSLALAVLFLTVYSGVTLNRDLSTGAFDRFRSLPIWRAAPIVGGLLGDAGRYLIASALVIGLGLGMGFRPHGGAVGVAAAVGLVLLFAFGLSWAWIALGVVLRTPNAVMSIGFTILFPLTFISNIFVEPATMPSVLHTLADVNPVTHLVTAERALMSTGATAGQIGWVLAATAAFTAIFAPLTMQLYRNRH